MPSEAFEYWIDADLPKQVAGWLRCYFNVRASHIADMLALHTPDEFIFTAAKERQDIIILTKDNDFASMAARSGYPPRIIHITAGNLSNDALQNLLKTSFLTTVLQMLAQNLPLIELQ